VYYGGWDVSKPHYEQGETPWDTRQFREHFYKQIAEYYKSHLDEGVAVYEEGEVYSEVDEGVLI
jgi:hypothetical protein